MKEDSMHLENTYRPHYRLTGLLLFAAALVAIAGGCEVFLLHEGGSSDSKGKAKEAPAAVGKDVKAPVEKAGSKKDVKVAQSWSMWGGQASRNMVNSFATGIPSSWDVATGKNIKWAAPLGSQSYGNPTIANGRVFVGTNNEGKVDFPFADRNNSASRRYCADEIDGSVLLGLVR